MKSVAPDPAAFGKRLRPALVYVGLLFALWSLYVAAVYPHVQRTAPVIRVLANEGIRGLIFLLPALLLLRAAATPDLPAALGLRRHVRRGLFWGLITAGALLGVHTLVRLGVQGTLRLSPVPVEAYFTALSVATLIEEVAFRGYLLQQLCGRMGFWGANAVSAALFAAIHIPGWLLVGGMAPGAQMLGPLGGIFVLGLALGALFRWTGSLWSSVLLHSAHNLASIVFYSAP